MIHLIHNAIQFTILDLFDRMGENELYPSVMAH